MNETELSVNPQLSIHERVNTLEESIRLNCQERRKIPSFTLSLGFTIPLPAPIGFPIPFPASSLCLSLRY